MTSNRAEKEPSIGARGQARGRPRGSQPVKQLSHSEQSASRDYWRLLNVPNALRRNTWRAASKNTKKEQIMPGLSICQAALGSVCDKKGRSFFLLYFASGDREFGCFPRINAFCFQTIARNRYFVAKS